MELCFLWIPKQVLLLIMRPDGPGRKQRIQGLKLWLERKILKRNKPIILRRKNQAPPSGTSGRPCTIQPENLRTPDKACGLGKLCQEVNHLCKALNVWCTLKEDKRRPEKIGSVESMNQSPSTFVGKSKLVTTAGKRGTRESHQTSYRLFFNGFGNASNCGKAT